jgi:polar amino acid transport system permease protein
MTDTSQRRGAGRPSRPAPGARTTPSSSDGLPTAAFALGASSVVLAPVVTLLVDVGLLGLLVPAAGIAAIQVAKRYRGGIDYCPPGDPVMRRCDLGRQAGLAGVVAFVALGLLSWVLGNDQLGRLGSLLFDLGRMGQAFPTLLVEGTRITLMVWVVAVVIGQVLGVVLALMAISRRAVFRLAAIVYIDVFRGLPAIITIVLIGQGLPLAGVRLFGSRNPLIPASIALGLVATAYVGEIVRAGIQSIDKGQMEAARSLGMPHGQAMRLIIIPQGLRRVVPPLTNEYIALLKDTSLIFVIGLAANASSFFEGRDLFRVGQNLAQQYGNYSPVVLAGIFYLVLTIPLTRLTNHLDRRLREGPGDVAAAEELPATVAPHGAVG